MVRAHAPDVADVVAAVSRRVDALGEKECGGEAGRDGSAFDRIFSTRRQDNRSCQEIVEPCRGHLELRIVANKKDEGHAEAIKFAKSLAQEHNVRNETGAPVGRWVGLPEHDLHPGDMSVQRDADGGRHDILVLRDSQNVTGQYISKAQKVKTVTGFAVGFVLTDNGGKLLHTLTGDNLPSDAGLLNRLGIIVDGQLIEAVTIRSEIGTKGEISGEFTEAQVADHIATLESGELPATLRLTSD